MDLICMDHNWFQRGFDDHEQPRIQMEAIACQAIFDLAEKNEVKLAGSFVYEVETEACPHGRPTTGGAAAPARVNLCPFMAKNSPDLREISFSWDASSNVT